MNIRKKLYRMCQVALVGASLALVGFIMKNVLLGVISLGVVFVAVMAMLISLKGELDEAVDQGRKDHPLR